ncbi:hypothetical protein KI387_006143, partial [Taxus chinensis]
MELAVRKGVTPYNALCSRKGSTYSAVNGNVCIGFSSLQRPHTSVTLRHCCRPNVTHPYPNIRVQAAKVTFSSFDDMLEKSEQPVLVDFYATWCGPCQYMVPILEDVSRRMKDKIHVVKIDTEKYPSIASRYGVQALPTFILFKNGQPFDRL